MRTSWMTAALCATTVLVSTTLGQVSEDAKQVMSEAGTALKKTSAMTFKAKRYGTGMLKDIIDSDGTVKFWRSKPDAAPKVRVTGRVKQPGKADFKLDAMTDGQSMFWLDWEKNTMFGRPMTDMEATQMRSYMEQVLLSEFTAPDPFEQVMKFPTLTKLGADNVGGVVCDVVEAMTEAKDRNTTWAIAVTDRLPRRLEMGTGKDTQKISMVVEISDMKTGVAFTDKDFEIELPTGFVKDIQLGAPAGAPEGVKKTATNPASQPAPATPLPASVGLAAGTPAPAFEAQDIAGQTISGATMKGNVVVLEFWGTMFKQATSRSAEMQALAAEMKDKNVKFVGMACREMNEKAAPDYWKNNKMSYPLVAKGDKIATDFKVSGFPTYVVINPDGNIAAYFQANPGKDALSAAIMAAMTKQ